MLNKFLEDKKVIFVNDRHEEFDTDREDRRKLYDKRILALLDRGDGAVFSEAPDPGLLDYYRGLGLAGIEDCDIHLLPDYIRYSSLTGALLDDIRLLATLAEKGYDYLMPYIYSENASEVADAIGARLPGRVDVAAEVNDKLFFKNILRRLGMRVLPSIAIDSHDTIEEAIDYIRESGFFRYVLKKRRSVAGFGVFPVLNDTQIAAIMRHDPKSEYLLEAWLDDVVMAPNLQYWVGSKEVYPLFSSDQILAEDGVGFVGNAFPAAMNDKRVLMRLAVMSGLRFTKYLLRTGYRGFLGLDMILSSKHGPFFIEANLRFNASTFPGLLAWKLFDHPADVHWKNFTFKTDCRDFREMESRFKKELLSKPGSYGLFPLALDLLGREREASVIVFGRSRQGIDNLIKRISK